MPNQITLSNNAEIELAVSQLLQCCREEYDYYDGLPKSDPNRIEPYDVLATVSMNSYITNAAQVRRIHRGMVMNCTHLLASIPEESNLLNCSVSTMADLAKLLHAAIQVPGVLMPVATKILHRKRTNFIPMLDNVVLAYYLNSKPNSLPAPTQDKRKAASSGMTVLEMFRQHLQSKLPQVMVIQSRLAQEGYSLTPVRIFELLIWITVEERGYYRDS